MEQAGIDDLARRPSAYVRNTGIPFLGVGSFWTMLGTMQLILPIAARVNRNFELTVAVVWVTIAMLIEVAALILQERLVRGRAGYASPRFLPTPPGPLVLMILGCVVLGWFLLHGLPAQEITEIAVPGFAAFLSLSVVALAWERKNRVGFCFAAYLIALTVALWWMKRGVSTELAWLEIGVGIPLAVYGVIRLRGFLKSHPEPVETVDIIGMNGYLR